MVVGFVQSPPLSRPCQYILVVVTPVQVFLLALTFSEDDVTKPLTIVPTGISCSTDGVGIVHAVGTNTGRIFLGGEDGCLYELGYHHNDSGGGLLAALMGDRPTKARKTNHTASVAVMALQALIGTRFLSPGLPLVRLAIDHDRSLLYTLSVDGEIKVRHGAGRVVAHVGDTVWGVGCGGVFSAVLWSAGVCVRVVECRSVRVVAWRGVVALSCDG